MFLVFQDWNPKNQPTKLVFVNSPVNKKNHLPFQFTITFGTLSMYCRVCLVQRLFTLNAAGEMNIPCAI